MKKFLFVIPLMGLLFASCQGTGNNDPDNPTTTTTEIKRTVKPTASFSMKVTGINPDGYPQWSGAEQICRMFSATCCKVNVGGHSSSSLMLLSPLSTTFQGYYDDVAMLEYVKDNSYVGARIICIDSDSYDNKLNESLTEEEKAKLMPYFNNYFTGTPDGPFQLKKTCTWHFRLGRDSSYTYVDEVIETYANSNDFKNALLSHTSDNPIFQSLYYYDAKKDEFILQDRKSWNLK